MSKKLLKQVLKELDKLRVAVKNMEKVTGVVTQTTPRVYNSDETPSFFRYIRPLDDCYGEINSQEGVTLKITFDYKNRALNFQYAICSHKNGEPSFSKKEGCRIASEHTVYSLPLWGEPGPLLETDVTAFIVAAIDSKQVEIPVGDRKHIVDQFSRSDAAF